MLPTSAAILIVVVAGLVGLSIWWQRSHSVAARAAFRDRDLVPPERQLQELGVSDTDILSAAIREWIRFARAYGYDANRLRASDRVDDLVKVDGFGDRGLEIEVDLNKMGFHELPAATNLGEVVLLLGGDPSVAAELRSRAASMKASGR